MQKRLINSQLCNYKTYLMYRRQCLTLAENVFKFINLPEFIDVSYVNRQLVFNGSIAFFADDVLGLLALPYENNGGLDVYGRPKRIHVHSNTGYSKNLGYGEFVIMYDNNGYYPLILDIVQYAERLALNTRTSDINISNQKTARFWKTKTENLESVKAIVNDVDAFSETVLSYDNLDLDDTSLVLEPAPFVTDKIDIHQEKIWNEFLRLIGVANLQYQKKERNIKDEVSAMQGGTIASRFSRFEPRKRAIELINKKFSNYLEKPIEIEYYDGLPTTLQTDEVENEELENMEGVE